MKKIDLDKLSPDPIAAARADADGETVMVRGFVRSVDKGSIAICASRTADSYLECDRRAVIAAFEEDDSDAVTFLLHADTQVRFVRTGKVSDRIATGDAAGLTSCSASHERDVAFRRAVAPSRVGIGPGVFSQPGLNYTCSGSVCGCAGDRDCNDMFSGGACAPGAPAVCYDVFGIPVCFCGR